MSVICLEVNKKNEIIGLRPMGDFQSGKYIHRSAHLLLFNTQGEVLMQKRSTNKKWYPNLYTYSVSGTVENESYEDCIKKEMKEEIGITTPVKLLFIYPFFDVRDKAFHALFTGVSDKKIKIDENEISSVIWISLEKLMKDLSNNSFNYVPHVVFGLKKYYNKIKINR